ncbi:MAG: thioesterase family protein [Chloroflexota bacterium]|nr:thioesterase family protein [Chloroflexota bacterium]
MLREGLRGEARTTVNESNVAAAYGAAVPVFSTPNMIGLMESSAINALAGHLEPGQTTVGTLVNVKHLAASPIGFSIVARAELAQVEGRRLVFAVEAYDDLEKIGEGQHERFLVVEEKFLQRTRQKKLP